MTISLTELGARISAAAAAIDAATPDTDPVVTLDMRLALQNDLNALKNRIAEPVDTLTYLAGASMHVGSLETVYRFKIHEAVPLQGTISYADLGEKVGLPMRRVRTVLRSVIAHNIFSEPVYNHVAHNAASEYMLKRTDYQPWIDMNFLDKHHMAALRLPEALQKNPTSQRSSDSGWNLVYDYFQGSLFHYMLHHDHAMQSRFPHAMKAHSMITGHSMHNIVNGYDWKSLPAGTKVVDVGGSIGSLAVLIAESNPHLSFVIEDLPEPVKEGRSTLPPHLRDRVEFQIVDFFQPQPVTGDIYLLRHILHDWADENAIKILKQIVPAMKPTSRIFIIDGVQFPPGKLYHPLELHQRELDMRMLCVVNSGERAREDWENLVTAADRKLSLLNVITPKLSLDSIIEVGTA